MDEPKLKTYRVVMRYTRGQDRFPGQVTRGRKRQVNVSAATVKDAIKEALSVVYTPDWTVVDVWELVATEQLTSKFVTLKR